MITYHYQCINCDEDFEIQQSIKAPSLRTCYKCQQDTLERVIHGGIHASVNQGVTTIGKQAEVNAKKMGKYQLSEIAEKTPKNDGKFVYTNKEKRDKINKMNPAQIQKYVIEGK